MKNFSYDKAENPFKFEYLAKEPPESLDSAFEIHPKLTSIGSRETQEFTLTFHPTKGVGYF